MTAIVLEELRPHLQVCFDCCRTMQALPSKAEYPIWHLRRRGGDRLRRLVNHELVPDDKVKSRASFEQKEKRGPLTLRNECLLLPP